MKYTIISHDDMNKFLKILFNNGITTIKKCECFPDYETKTHSTSLEAQLKHDIFDYYDYNYVTIYNNYIIYASHIYYTNWCSKETIINRKLFLRKYKLNKILQ